jgi:hypothetical protein
MMLAEHEEYDELIRSRLSEIDAMYNSEAGEKVSAEITPGAEENMIEEVTPGDTPGAEEHLLSEESAGAEENMDSSDNNDQSAGETAVSNPQAA